MSREIQVRVQPRSSQNKLEWQADGSVKVWTNAPPVDGAANEAVCALLAKDLGVAKSLVQVVKGNTSRSKVVRVEG